MQEELSGDYLACMREARRNREKRAKDMAAIVRHYLWPQLAPLPAEPEHWAETPEERRWSLRGEPRTRATFSAPHPADFPGGLPIPPEYPRR